ncbi:MAG: glycosyltransferase, partial [Desulfosarcina sp.]|nr:glycosyltransferase [Desulfosarcina sp.]
NRGLAAARGELIAYLDSDNTWRPDYLKSMAGFFQVQPDANAAYSGQYLYRGCEHEPFAVRFGRYNPSLLRNRNYIDLNCFVHRRDVLKAIGGGFSEAIERWVDWELILRIARVSRISSVPILQSNYYLDKAKNTITSTEDLDPARNYIMEKIGCGRQGGFQQGGGSLTKKVTVIVSAHGGRGNRDACIESLKAYSRDPLVEVLVLIDSSDPAASHGLADLEDAGMKTIVPGPGVAPFHAVDQAVRRVDPENDLLIVDMKATLMTGALPALQKTAYTGDAIAITVPQQVLPGGDPSITNHVPYAFDDVPCDIALSHHHRNIEPLPLFHNGGPVDLNFASFFCVYIKRDAWDLCGGLDVHQERESQFDRIMCEFVRHVLGRRIVYTPDAVVLHQSSSRFGN